MADRLEVLGRQHVQVAAGDHDVLDLGARGDVGDGGMPALRVGLEAGLLDGVGVAADRVAARAEAAIDRADVERQEQRLVVVAVRQAGRRRVGLLVERVERQARVIRQLGRGDRQELDPERIAIRIGPVGQGDDVGRDPDVHRRAGDAGADVVEEGRRHAVAEHRGELVEARDAVLVLELPVHEGGAIDVGVAGDLPPELVVPEVAVGEGLGIDGRPEGGGHREIHQLGQHRVFRPSPAATSRTRGAASISLMRILAGWLMVASSSLVVNRVSRAARAACCGGPYVPAKAAQIPLKYGR